MRTNQALQIAFETPFRPLLTAIFIALRDAAKRMLDSRNAGLREPVGAELEAHQRYDVGEIDCRPNSQLSAREPYQQQSLEAMWLRHHRRM